ncbi:uncharacterized protein LOC144294716 [Canis aureus]
MSASCVHLLVHTRKRSGRREHKAFPRAVGGRVCCLPTGQKIKGGKDTDQRFARSAEQRRRGIEKECRASASPLGRGPAQALSEHARTNMLFPGGSRPAAKERLCSITVPATPAFRMLLSGPR